MGTSQGFESARDGQGIEAINYLIDVTAKWIAAQLCNQIESGHRDGRI